MASPVVVVHFKDVEIDDIVRESVQKRCEHLADEFREARRFEVTIEESGLGYDVHGHATGKHTDVATHAHAENPRMASDQVLEKIEKQLRKSHDKRIFSQRREAQRHPPKRGEAL